MKINTKEIKNQGNDSLLINSTSLANRTSGSLNTIGSRSLESSAVTMQTIYSSYSHPAYFYLGKGLAVGKYNSNRYGTVIVGIPGSIPSVMWAINGNSGYNILNAPINSYNGDSTFSELISNAGNFNQGFDADVVTASYSKIYFYLFYGNGQGAFPTFSKLSTGESLNYGVLAVGGIGDVNGDAYDDIVVINGRSTTSSVSVTIANIVMGNSNGDASRVVNVLSGGVSSTPTYGSRSVVKLGDVNSDGYNDFALTFATTFGCYIYILLGNSGYRNGQSINLFSQTNNYGGGDCILRAAGADLDGDGIRDIVVAACDTLYVIKGTRILPENTILSAAATYTITGYNIEHLSFGGDFNNDGYEDVVLDCSSDSATLNSCGTVIFGGPNLPRQAILSTLEISHRSYTFAYSAPISNVQTQYTSIVGGFDFNNDGFSDVMFGYGSATVNGNANAGAVTIAYGVSNSQMFPTPTSSQTKTPSSSSHNVIPNNNEGNTNSLAGSLNIILGVTIPVGVLIAAPVVLYALKCLCKTGQNIAANPNAPAIEMAGKAIVTTVVAAAGDVLTGGALGSATGASDLVPTNVKDAVELATAMHDHDLAGVITNPIIQAQIAEL